MLKSSKVGRIIIGVLLALMAGVFVVKTWFINLYRIPHNQMYPAIKAESLIFARLHPYKDTSQVKRGDVVVFKQVEDGETGIFVLRVIGLPGDTVESAGDAVTVNGKALPREKVRQEQDTAIYRETNDAATYEVAFQTNTKGDPPRADGKAVPANQLFLMGDNRLDAHDSRIIGPVKFEAIVGKKL